MPTIISTISENISASNEAPPTNAPSMFFSTKKSAAFDLLTLPPYTTCGLKLF